MRGLRRSSGALVIGVLLLGACGDSGEPASEAERSATTRADDTTTPTPPAESTVKAISYDGTLTTKTPGQPENQHDQVLGVFCADEETCNLTGVGVDDRVITLTRTGAGSFTIDMPGTPRTCEEGGTTRVTGEPRVTGTLELAHTTATMTLDVAGATVACPSSEIVEHPQTLTFAGTYVDGGIPGFTVD